MHTLVIDTSCNVGLVALASGGRVFAHVADLQHAHSRVLVTVIDGLLVEAGLVPADLGLLGVGVGPGSFTGIRIAVSTARMFAQVLRLPLVPVYSPELYAVSVPCPAGDEIVVAFDAKKGRVFGARYVKLPDGGVGEIVPPGDHVPRVLLAERGDRAAHLVGDGAERYHAELTGELRHARLYPAFMPSGERACELVLKKFGRNREAYGNFHLVTPFYGRKSDAETALEERRRATCGPSSA